MAFAHAAASSRSNEMPVILRGSDVPIDRHPRSTRHLPNLQALRVDEQVVNDAKILWSDLDVIRFIYDDDTLDRREVVAARAFGQHEPAWLRYLGAVGRLRRAQAIVLGLAEPTGQRHRSCFIQAAQHLRQREPVDEELCLQLELFDTDPAARRAHFADAASGGSVDMPRRR